MKPRTPAIAIGPLLLAVLAACSSGTSEDDLGSAKAALEPAAVSVTQLAMAAVSLPLGAACGTATACASGACVDGVCCNSACGGGATGDCQACSFAAGAQVNGQCGPVRAGVECRAASGICDAAEICNGTKTTCPADKPKPRGSVCRPASGACDVADSCDGTAKACPANAVRPGTFTCRAKAGPCDVADRCTGNSADCPLDVLQPTTVVCRGKAGVCDVAETCSGFDPACPDNVMAPAGSVCRAATNVCDAAEQCNGSAPACPADAVAVAGTECRAAAGTCDLAEQCNGTAKACPANKLLARTTVCRPARGGGCDLAESCSGTAASCPVDQTRANGSSCNDGDACTRADTCQAGSCSGGNPVICAAADQCHDAGTCDPSSGSCSSPPVADGTACSAACVTGSTCRAGACQGGQGILCGTATFAAAGTLPFAAAPWSTTVTLLRDGRVMLISVHDQRPYLWNPQSGSGTFAAPLPTARTHHAAVRLADGKIFVSGGRISAALDDTWLYDPTYNTWTAGPTLGARRMAHKAVVLGDGRVLIIGGAARGAEIYDPGSNSMVGAIDSPAFTAHAAVLLADGRIFVAGGPEAPGIFDVGAMSFTPAPALPAVRFQPLATRMADGRVLLAGGAGDDDIRAVDIFDPAAATWSRGASSRRFHWGAAGAVTLDGKIMLAGGLNDLAGAEIYDPANGLWADAQPLQVGRQEAFALTLPEGDVLVLGGISNAGEPTLVERLQLRGASACVAPGSCDLQTGTCSQPLRPDGSSCTAGGTCFNGPESCQAGFCGSAGPLPAAIPVGTEAAGVLVSRDGRRAYVTGVTGGQGGLAIIDTASRMVLRTVPLPARPGSITASPDERKLFIGHGYEGGHNLISVVDLGEPPTVTSFDLGQGIYPGTAPVLFAPNGRLYAGRYPLGNLTTIDPRTGQVLATTALGRDYGNHLALSPDGDQLYVSHFDGGVTAFDISQPAPTPAGGFAVPQGANGVAFLSPSQGLVSGWGAGELFRFDLASGALSSLVTTGSPGGLALAPDHRQALVSNYAENQLVIVDLPNATAVRRVATGRGPGQIALSPEGKVAYVANGIDGSLSVISVCGDPPAAP